MKIIIASDLHGSVYYGGMLVQRFLEERAEEIVLLGDLYYHGPRNPMEKGYDPMALCELLNSYKEKLIVIQGNCDSEVDQMISEFKFLGTSNINFGNLKLTLTHGHIFDIDNMPKGVGDVFLYGHTHMGFIEKRGGVIVANPGSVTLPKGGTPRSYLVLTDNEIILKELESKKVITSMNI